MQKVSSSSFYDPTILYTKFTFAGHWTLFIPCGKPFNNYECYPETTTCQTTSPGALVFVGSQIQSNLIGEPRRHRICLVPGMVRRRQAIRSRLPPPPYILPNNHSPAGNRGRTPVWLYKRSPKFLIEGRHGMAPLVAIRCA